MVCREYVKHGRLSQDAPSKPRCQTLRVSSSRLLINEIGGRKPGILRDTAGNALHVL